MTRPTRWVLVVVLTVAGLVAIAFVAGIDLSREEPARERKSGAAGSERPITRGGKESAKPTDLSDTPAFGMMAWRANTLDRAEFALIASTGARIYRFNLLTSNQDDAEPRLKTKRYDRLIKAAVRESVDVLPVLLRSRPNEKPVPPNVAEPPETAREQREWRRRVRFYAQRYGPDGRFWRANPRLPYRPVRAWEVWNEPNLRQFWDNRRPDAREYGRLLRETRAVLRQVDPQARIVSAGLAWRYAGPRYLAAALDSAEGCSTDAIGVHPYAPTADRAVANLSEARSVAERHGAARAPLWTTEIGWRVGEGRGYSVVPDAKAQARALDEFAAATTRRREQLGLGPTFVFALRDRVNEKTGRVDHTAGLRRADGSARPSWRVWSRWARRTPALPLPPARACGDGET